MTRMHASKKTESGEALPDEVAPEAVAPVPAAPHPHACVIVHLCASVTLDES